MYGNTIFDKLKVFVCEFIKNPIMFFLFVCFLICDESQLSLRHNNLSRLFVVFIYFVTKKKTVSKCCITLRIHLRHKTAHVNWDHLLSLECEITYFISRGKRSKIPHYDLIHTCVRIAGTTYPKYDIKRNIIAE